MNDHGFGNCLKFVLLWEGGYSNTPGDPGGPTNFGVIQVEYDAYRTHHKLPKQSVKAITPSEVNYIYIQNYWTPVKGDFFVPHLSLVMFDTAVNMGVGTAMKMLQRALGMAHTSGVWDSQTAQAFSKHNDMHAICWSIVGLREARYRNIAMRRGMGQFLKGWLRRLHALKQSAGLMNDKIPQMAMDNNAAVKTKRVTDDM